MSKAATQGATEYAAITRIKLVRSPIGYPKEQRHTLRALGLQRLGAERVLSEDENTPELLGMVRKVRHLLEVTQ